MTAKAVSEPEVDWGGIPTVGDIPVTHGITARVTDQTYADIADEEQPKPQSEAVDDDIVVLLRALLQATHTTNAQLGRVVQAYEEFGKAVERMMATTPPQMPVGPLTPFPQQQPQFPQQPWPNQPAQIVQATPQMQADPNTWVCPIHATGAKLVPAGVSRTTNRPYAAFWACVTPGCRQRVR